MDFITITAMMAPKSMLISMLPQQLLMHISMATMLGIIMVFWLIADGPQMLSMSALVQCSMCL